MKVLRGFSQMNNEIIHSVASEQLYERKPTVVMQALFASRNPLVVLSGQRALRGCITESGAEIILLGIIGFEMSVQVRDQGDRKLESRRRKRN